MRGTWKLRNNLIGVVEEEQPDQLLGWVGYDALKIPTYWSLKGDSASHDFDLIEKIQGPEFFSTRKGLG